MPVGHRRGRARKELVPGAEARALGVDDERQLRVRHRKPRLDVALRERAERGVETERAQVAPVGRRVAQRARPRLEAGAFLLAGALCRLRDQRRAQPRRRAQILGILAPGEVAPPRGEGVDPRPHRVAVGTDALQAQFAAPAVVEERLHRQLGPRARALRAPQQLRQHDIVAVGEAVRLDDEQLADRPLDGKAAAVDLRRHGLDHRARAPVGLERGHPPSWRNNVVESGGRVTVSEWNRPCAPTGAASTPP